MIKEALEYIVKSQQPKVIASGGHHYTDARLERLDNDLRANAIHMTTLSSLGV